MGIVTFVGEMPAAESMSKVIELLDAAELGDRQATADLFLMVYDELKRLAASYLAGEHVGHTLQPTALVHEVYLRLMGTSATPSPDEPGRWKDQRHFFATAAEAMRRILIDSARRRKRQKRGGDLAREDFDPNQIAQPEKADELIALDEALDFLAQSEPQIAELVKLRYFGGLTLKEAAAALDISPRTADFHWAYARAWLLAKIKGAGASEK